MKKLTTTLMTLMLMLMAAAPTFAWGDEGHETVGQLAELYLRADNATTTLNRINQILNQNESLASVAVWADRVKHRRFGPQAQDADADTKAFLRDLRNAKNGDWHFVDLPLGCPSYDACNTAPLKFTNPTDIVQMIRVCIRVLTTNAAHPRFTKRNALRLLVHLVGDLHQPLHVGSGFVDPNGTHGSILIVRDPAVIKQKGLESDHGANLLLLLRFNGQKMHAFWDGNLVEDLMEDDTLEDFADRLKGQTPDTTGFNTTGPIDGWPAKWASESVVVSGEKAYQTIKIRREHIEHKLVNGHFEDVSLGFDVRSGNDYEQNNQAVASAQLTKAGFHLAKLLEAIFH